MSSVRYKKKGTIIFGGLILAALAFSITAYVISGHMGIEDRFNSAIGMNSESKEARGSGFFGFDIEGNPLFYIVILAALFIACAALFAKFKL